jgi:pilus assembly protein FimV
VVTIVKKSKVRLLTKTLAVVSLLAPASGHTLGIGEIKLHSALNQNLDAEIALILSGESVSDIKVNLAPPEKFDEAGVAWTYFLSKIKLETVTNSNGAAVIKLTSKEALKEPFLDFLLEVTWPKGNLYREFTVLVDPPSVYNQATIPVSTSTQSYEQPPAAMSHANGQSTDGEYGPTLENDTLWSVAERAKGQSNVSVEQMMMAIYEANPHAFYKGNVYALTTGKMLKIPEKEAALKLSRNQALAEFNRHTKAWKNHSAPAHPESKEKPVLSKGEGPVDNQLTLIAPTKAAVTDHAVIASVNEREKKVADSSTPSKTVKGKEAITIDGVTQSKIAELEKQLAMMQELIALKDQQLAALQNQSKESQAAPSEAITAKPAEQVAPASEQAVIQPVQPNQAAPGEVVAAKPAEQVAPASEQAVVQPVQPNQAVPGEVVTAKPAEQVAPASEQAVIQPVQPNQAVPSQVAPVKPVEQVTRVPQQTAVPVPPVVRPESEADNLLDPLYLKGGAGAAIFTLLGWLWWRKRKVDKETNTESMFASSAMIETPEANENISVPVVDDGVAVSDAGTVGESSFLSEFTPSDFDSFDTDQGEIDPISEADVYLAYGRYQQAEELIRQAIKDQPNRDECKLKLLEIFYANENKTAFEAYANELVAAGKRNEAVFWEQAAEMGREICPDSPLFSSGNDLFPVADDTAVENIHESVAGDGPGKADINVGTASFVQSASDDFVEVVEPKGEALDFDSSDFDSSETEDESFVDEQRNNEDINFDLSSFSMDAIETDEAEKGVIASSTQTDKPQIEDIDFDLGSFSMDDSEANEAEKGVIASSTQADKPQIEDIDFDLSSFSMGTEADESEKDDITSSIRTDKPQIEDIDFDLSSFSMGTEVDESEKDDITSSIRADKPQIEDIDFDLSSFSMGAESDESEKDDITSSTRADTPQIEDIDFDLSSFSMDAESDESEKDDITSCAQADKPQIEGIDFDLSSFSMDDYESDELDKDFTSGANISDKTQEFETHEFDFNSGNTETTKVDDLDFNTVLNDQKKHQGVNFSADNSLDFNDDLGSDFDFDFDLDIPSTTSVQSSNHDGFGVSDLTDMDELETKLDLAKAYVDMGDANAAKDIAREVLEQGTVEQKKIAQALLDELD